MPLIPKEADLTPEAEAGQNWHPPVETEGPQFHADNSPVAQYEGVLQDAKGRLHRVEINNGRITEHEALVKSARKVGQHAIEAADVNDPRHV